MKINPFQDIFRNYSYDGFQRVGVLPSRGSSNPLLHQRLLTQGDGLTNYYDIAF